MERTTRDARHHRCDGSDMQGNLQWKNASSEGGWWGNVCKNWPGEGYYEYTQYAWLHLSTSMVLFLTDFFLSVRANVVASKDESLTENEVLGQMSYVKYPLFPKDGIYTLSAEGHWFLLQWIRHLGHFHALFIFFLSTLMSSIACGRKLLKLKNIMAEKIYHTTRWYRFLTSTLSAGRLWECELAITFTSHL
jgi:hypothetical protein